jgi:hypothetical protein
MNIHYSSKASFAELSSSNTVIESIQQTYVLLDGAKDSIVGADIHKVTHPSHKGKRVELELHVCITIMSGKETNKARKKKKERNEGKSTKNMKILKHKP